MLGQGIWWTDRVGMASEDALDRDVLFRKMKAKSENKVGVLHLWGLEVWLELSFPAKAFENDELCLSWNA